MPDENKRNLIPNDVKLRILRTDRFTFKITFSIDNVLKFDGQVNSDLLLDILDVIFKYIKEWYTYDEEEEEEE